MQSELQPGNEVMLTSGVFGTIEQIADDHMRLRIADGVTVKVAKGAVGNVVDRRTRRLRPRSPSRPTEA